MKPEELSKANRDCLAKAKPGEPVFIILGRDPDGAAIVRLWAKRRAGAGDPGHAIPVLAIADDMDAWRAAGNLPDSAPDADAYPPVQLPDEVSDDLKDALATAWRDFLEANPDDLTSPDDLPDHALVTFDQMVGIMIDALILVKDRNEA